MGGRYRAYSEYKDSGVEWLRDIPSHWDIYDGKRIFKNRRELARDDDQQLAASQKYGVIPQSLMMELNDSKVMLALKGTDSFRHVEKNDFVISLRSFEGGIEYSGYEGCVSPAYTVLDSLKTISHGFYRYLFKSRPFIAALQSKTDSLRDGKSITYQQFGAIPSVLPPEAEQTQIAKFLDHEIAKIDTLIDKQQLLIALLKEKRQAVISHAVTKGLNPDAPMKGSGVEWLGEVPEHWEVCRIKHIVHHDKDSMVDGPFGSSVDTATDYVENGVPVIRTVNITNAGFSSENLKYMRVEKFNILKRHAVYPGDVLFSKVGTIGNACILPPSTPEAILSTTGSCKIKVNDKKYIAEYLVLVIQLMHQELMLIANANVQSFLNMANIKNLLVPLPSIEEQLNILKMVNRRISIFDNAIEKATTSKELLQERRIALISAAVTGKIDVRHWQSPPSNSTTSKDNP